MTFYFASGDINEAISLVKKYHYSHRAPANIQFVGTAHRHGGLWGDLGEMVAACFFSIPPTRWSENVLELSRLVRIDSVDINLTWLIAKSCRQLKKRDCDLVVSFADNTHGHHGGIYQAASWNYHGTRTNRMDGLIVNDVFVPGRTCNSRWGTRSPSKLSKMLPWAKIEPHFDIGKNLYWRALRKSGKRKAARLGLVSSEYPKPQQGKAS